jgi:hypothetical protein
MMTTTRRRKTMRRRRKRVTTGIPGRAAAGPQGRTVGEGTADAERRRTTRRTKGRRTGMRMYVLWSPWLE